MSEPAQHLSAQVGVIGLAVMGRNLARNLARHGYRVAIYNRTFLKTKELLKNYDHEGIFLPYEQLTDFVASLARPRRIIIMVKAGSPTDKVISELINLLEPGDIVVDGGNAHYADTIRREKQLTAYGLHFMGAGISGGEVGALEGPAIMPGGSLESYRIIGPILETIAAKVNGEPCCTYIGTGGSGHFVKMIHNGIEYADIQFICEAFDLLRALGFSYKEMSQIFESWNNTSLNSYLIEITSDVLEQIDSRTGKPLIEIIEDEAGQKGTGSWSVQTSLEFGSSVSTIAESVFAREISSNRKLRNAAHNLQGPKATVANLDKKSLVANIRSALWASKIIAYAQGLDEISAANNNYGWDIKLTDCAKIWRGGCIIRAQLLENIRQEYTKHSLTNLLASPTISAEMAAVQDGWRQTIIQAINLGIPTPGLSAALSYYDSIRATRLPAALTQGLRDYFGAHTYRRIDDNGSFHILWSGSRREIKT